MSTVVAPTGEAPSVPRLLTARVITVSDRCSRGEAEDLSGPLAARELSTHGVDVDRVDVVPDGVASVRRAIRAALSDGARLVLTTGGTGISPTDWTPEATEALITLRLPGVEDAIRRRSEAHAPGASLSRGLVGLSARGEGAALLVNAPGSPGGVKDTVAVIGPLLGHVLDQAAGGDHPRPHGHEG